MHLTNVSFPYPGILHGSITYALPLPEGPLAPLEPFDPLAPLLPLRPRGPSGPGGHSQVCSVCLFVISRTLSWFVIVRDYILIKHEI